MSIFTSSHPQKRNNQKFFIICSVIILGIVSGCLIARLYTRFAGNPVIQINEFEINFGAIAAGTKATKTVEVRNAGKGNLIIREIKTGCGCTQVCISSNVIAPNTVAQLYITMDATDYGQKTDIYIFSNDFKHKTTMLSVSAEAAMKTIAEPSVVDFGQITLEQLPVNKEVNLCSTI